ncbi:upstream stimulatory factor 2-like [Anthonomus grandis grandis]|uniref:upstream stimulatory factor 2-like n=1 Tax=Anthonomus grandis grandis TaxID=2921223 RepID=UPI0021654B57|nr:upstream stimulatory factor 2-like [Anthonomus grandis grandis]
MAKRLKQEIVKEELQEKIILNTIKEMDSEDEHCTVDQMAPQTLLEDADGEVQYTSEGPIITYRVLQVGGTSDDTGDSQEYLTTTNSGFASTTTIPQVISSSNLNGQLYVLGSPEQYNANSVGRPIAPRPPILDTSVVVQVKKRDERRRATHNEVERRRRDKINNWIAKLAKILPESPQDVKGNGQYDGHSKGGVLAKAFEYIIELQATETRLGSCLKENKKLANAVDQLRNKNFALEAENMELKELLKKHGVDVDGS